MRKIKGIRSLHIIPTITEEVLRNGILPWIQTNLSLDPDSATRLLWEVDLILSHQL